MLACAGVFRRVLRRTPLLRVLAMFFTTAVPAVAWAASPVDWVAARLPAAAATDTSALVVALIALNMALAGGIAVFLGAGLATRWARAWDQARRAHFAAHWEPHLHGRIAGDTDPLPHLARRDHIRFLMLWLHLAGYVQGEGEDALRTIGIEAGISARVVALLDARAPWQRLLAARATALLRAPAAQPALLRMAAGADHKLALAAVEALLRIAPETGDAQFRALLLRGGWSPSQLVNAASANPAAAGRVLDQALASAPVGGATAIIRLIVLAGNAGSATALRARLAAHQDEGSQGGGGAGSGSSEGETAALLQALGRFGAAEDRPAALHFLGDTRWPVRMQAAFALGHLGQAHDMPLLAALLGDAEWWVRYRAAQAMLKLARGDRALLALTMDQVQDRFARDAMAFAVAEFEWQPAH